MLRISILLFLLAACNERLPAQDDPPAFLLGADVSFLPQLERNGAVFTQDGQPQDLMALLKTNGMNTIRLRLWHTPASGWNDLDATVELARRIDEAGLDLFLDIHYSDTWADPGRQTKPAAWEGLTFDILRDSVYQYSKHVLGALKTAGVVPRYVQPGNEIIQGMLWDDGRVGGAFDTPAQWQKLAALLQSASDGIRDGLGDDSTSIVIHIDRGGDTAGARWFFDHLTAESFAFDAIGLSYYPWWHGSFEAFEQTLADVAGRYGKPVIIAETAYPWTLQWFDNTNNIVGSPDHLLPGYNATPEGQYAFLRDLIQKVKADGLGKGVFYWAPEYIAVPGVGSPWENVALFDPAGEALKGLQAFREAAAVSVERPAQGDGLSATVYPNPFVRNTTVAFELPAAARVTIALFGVDGRRHAVPVRDQPYPAGTHRIRIDGATLPAGVYLFRIVAGGMESTGGLLKR